MQTGKVNQTLTKLAHALENAGIDYAIVGGMALVLHGYVRATQDIDVLLSTKGLEAFTRTLVGRGFVAAFPGAIRAFRDSETGVIIEILISGEFPGDGRPKPVKFPEPQRASIYKENIRVVSLRTLIEMKLASGLSAPNRLKDLADVQELIQCLNLERSMVLHLNESVQAEYIRLWKTINGEDR